MKMCMLKRYSLLVACAVEVGVEHVVPEPGTVVVEKADAVVVLVVVAREDVRWNLLCQS